MKKAALELGGSDPFIVLDDANIDMAATKAITGRMKTNGQACNNAKRFIIQEGVYDKFVQKLIQKLNEYIKIGDPMDENVTIGPIVNQKQLDKIRSQIKESIDKGAKMIYGDLSYKIKDSQLSKGFYFQPVILENISKDQPAYFEELFAPVFSLFSFKDDIDAATLANDSQFGLSGSVISTNLERAKSLAMKLEVGDVYINEAVGSDPAIPSGGVKDSGFGRECHRDGILEVINRKAICVMPGDPKL